MSKAFREALHFFLWFISVNFLLGAQAGFHGVELDKDLDDTLDFLKNAGFACGAQSYCYFTSACGAVKKMRYALQCMRRSKAGALHLFGLCCTSFCVPLHDCIYLNFAVVLATKFHLLSCSEVSRNPPKIHALSAGQYGVRFRGDRKPFSCPLCPHALLQFELWMSLATWLDCVSSSKVGCNFLQLAHFPNQDLGRSVCCRYICSYAQKTCPLLQ